MLSQKTFVQVGSSRKNLKMSISHINYHSYTKTIDKVSLTGDSQSFILHNIPFSILKNYYNLASWSNGKLNSVRPSDAYMHRSTRPLLVQLMACRLVGAKPLSEPILGYC